MLRRHMAKNSGVHDLGRIYGLLRIVSAGAPGHGPFHLLLSSAPTLGYTWSSDLCIWQRPGLRALCQLSSPLQYLNISSLLSGMLGEIVSLAILVLELFSAFPNSGYLGS